ncbi:MAG: hypothetical protein HPY57_14220 [Ignavibacteria bacterium]|nr:hypothetical protein [Ignavibacteria bacterium]
MKVWEVVYVTFAFKNDKGLEIEKTKKYLVTGESEKEAENNFLSKNIKFKKIKSITENMSNTLGNICPELIKLRNQMLK